jgi:hypothetical protein
MIHYLLFAGSARMLDSYCAARVSWQNSAIFMSLENIKNIDRPLGVLRS